jgi:hypothetical protein
MLTTPISRASERHSTGFADGATSPTGEGSEEAVQEAGESPATEDDTHADGSDTATREDDAGWPGVAAGTDAGGVEAAGAGEAGVDAAGAGEVAAIAAGAIPAGWYADPSGQGERWWTGDGWSEHVRTPPGAPGESRTDGSETTAHDPAAPEAQPTEDEPTQAIPPVDPATGSAGGVGGASSPGATAGASSVAPQAGHQGNFTMTGVGAVPPTGPPPEGDDDGGGGGSRKLIYIVLLVVVLLAAVGAALWFFTDVFDQADPVPAADEAEAAERTAVEAEPAPEPDDDPEPTFTSMRDVDLAVVDWSTSCVGTEASPSSRAPQPQLVTFDDATSTLLLWPDDPHDP